MLLSDVSIKRPVFATVIGLLLVAIGIVLRLIALGGLYAIARWAKRT